MHKISSLYLGRAHQAIRGEYYKQTVDIVENSGLVGIIEPAIWQAFRTDVMHYFTIVSQYKASPRTRAMQRYDRARTAVFQHLRQGLKMMRNSEDDKVVAYYAQHVQPLVEQYTGYDVKKEPMAKTSDFRAFGRDVKKLNARLLQRAFVGRNEVNRLLELCDLFEEAYVTRDIDRTQLEDIPALFGRIEELWLQISAAITVLANSAITDDNRSDVEAARTLIGIVNENSAYYRNHYLRKNKTEEKENEASRTDESLAPVDA